jgi:hypothetical protein
MFEILCARFPPSCPNKTADHPSNVEEILPGCLRNQPPSSPEKKWATGGVGNSAFKLSSFDEVNH